MSAPTALESGALLRGIATWAPVTSEPGRLPDGVDRDRRRGGALAVLGREHDHVARRACDPLEIAAVLEAAGLDDRRARSDYQVAGVFEVAEQIWQATPWRPAAEAARVDLWRLPLWRAQMRGLLYAVPALLAAVVPAHLEGPSAYMVLVAATVASIMAAQALSVLAHVLLGRGQRRAFAALAMAALATATGVGVAGFGLAAALGLPLGLAAVPAAQALFVTGATLLMVDAGERTLACLIAPGVIAAGALALTGSRSPTGFAAAAAAVVLLTVLGALVRSCLWRRPRRGDGLRQAVGAAELRSAGVAAGYGLGLAGLVSFAVLAAAAGRVVEGAVWMVVATAPLTATIGTAEYLLHRARSRTAAALTGIDQLRAFADAARGQLRAVVAVHTLIVLGVAAVVVAVVYARQPDPVLVAYALTYAVLSVLLLLTTVLVSLDHQRTAATATCAGGAAVVALDAVPALSGVALVAVQGAVLSVLLVVVYRLAAARFAMASAHR